MFSNQKITNIIKVTIPGSLFLLILMAGSCSTTKAINPNAGLFTNTNNSNEEEAKSEVKEKNKSGLKDEKPEHQGQYSTSLNKQIFSIFFESDAEEYAQVKADR